MTCMAIGCEEPSFSIADNLFLCGQHETEWNDDSFTGALFEAGISVETIISARGIGMDNDEYIEWVGDIDE